jgi:hypothetical protein
LGGQLGVEMSQRENPDNDGPCRNSESELNNGVAGRADTDVDGSLADGIMLDPKVQAQLGRVFRAYCDDLIHQPIPDKFTVLLAKLEAKQREKK